MFESNFYGAPLARMFESTEFYGASLAKMLESNFYGAPLVDSDTSRSIKVTTKTYKRSAPGALESDVAGAGNESRSEEKKDKSSSRIKFKF